MMRVLIASFLLLCVAGCNAADTESKLPDPKQREAAQERYQKALDDLRKKFNEREFGKARIVPKGAKPEIVLKNDTISFNGKPLVLEKTLQDWEKALGKAPRCDERKYAPRICFWDEWGISVKSSRNNANIIDEFTIYVNLEPQDPYEHLITQLPDGNTKRKSIDVRPRHLFSGYLELDGFGIDAKTKFWEIRTNVKTERNLRCSNRECFPHGYFSETANLYMTLDRNSEQGQLYELTITSDR